MLHNNIYNLEKRAAVSAPVTDELTVTPNITALLCVSSRGRGLLAQMHVKALHPARV